MGAPLGDDSLVQHEDLVCFPDGAEPVGDDKGGPALHHLDHGAVDLPLGFYVNAGRGVVQNEDRRVNQDGAGD